MDISLHPTGSCMFHFHSNVVLSMIWRLGMLHSVSFKFYLHNTEVMSQHINAAKDKIVGIKERGKSTEETELTYEIYF